MIRRAATRGDVELTSNRMRGSRCTLVVKAGPCIWFDVIETSTAEAKRPEVTKIKSHHLDAETECLEELISKSCLLARLRCLLNVSKTKLNDVEASLNR